MTLEVAPVRGRGALGKFVGLPWSLYDRIRYPQWVPPLRAMVADGVDLRNPFYREAERELFLAFRGGRPVGRIAAIQNRRHNEFHGDRTGFFGFFECAEGDGEAARALLDAAAAWLGERGLETLRGPTNPSTNHECGLLVDGFDSPTPFMTPWNPPSYPALLEGTGLRKIKDLLGFWLPVDLELPERYRRVAERVRERSRLEFRLLDRSRFDEEAERVWTIYNDAWEKNWGFVPMSRAEFNHMASLLKHLVLEEFAWFMEIEGEPAAFALALPDYNLTLRGVPSGRLFPFGLIKLLRDRTRIRRGRIILLGVRERFRSKSIYFLFMTEFMRRGRAYGAEGTDASWILEDNEAIVDFFREAGLAPTRRWRIYERPLAGI